MNNINLDSEEKTEEGMSKKEILKYSLLTLLVIAIAILLMWLKLRDKDKHLVSNILDTEVSNDLADDAEKPLDTVPVKQKPISEMTNEELTDKSFSIDGYTVDDFSDENIFICYARDEYDDAYYQSQGYLSKKVYWEIAFEEIAMHESFDENVVEVDDSYDFLFPFNVCFVGDDYYTEIVGEGGVFRGENSPTDMFATYLLTSDPEYNIIPFLKEQGYTEDVFLYYIKGTGRKDYSSAGLYRKMSCYILDEDTWYNLDYDNLSSLETNKRIEITLDEWTLEWSYKIY